MGGLVAQALPATHRRAAIPQGARYIVQIDVSKKGKPG